MEGPGVVAAAQRQKRPVVAVEPPGHRPVKCSHKILSGGLVLPHIKLKYGSLGEDTEAVIVQGQDGVRGGLGAILLLEPQPQQRQLVGRRPEAGADPPAGSPACYRHPQRLGSEDIRGHYHHLPPEVEENDRELPLQVLGEGIPIGGVGHGEGGPVTAGGARPGPLIRIVDLAVVDDSGVLPVQWLCSTLPAHIQQVVVHEHGPQPAPADAVRAPPG
mmetsp:Transcript_27902/g.72201  ORF Transcript_27902/g.72201 Transcript_27902/m.72201 type:complete len:217 (+) Transcript_27902:662-1312(+)